MSRSTSGIHQKRPLGEVLKTGHSICPSLPLQAGQGAMAHETPCAHLYDYNDYSEQQNATDTDRSVHEVCKRSGYVNQCQTRTHCRDRAPLRTNFFISIINGRYYTAKQSGSCWSSSTTQCVNEQILTNLLNSQLKLYCTHQTLRPIATHGSRLTGSGASSCSKVFV